MVNMPFENFIDFMMMKIIAPVMFLGVIAIFFVGIPILIFATYTSANEPTFALKKAEWTCTKEYEYTTHYKVTVTHHDCERWEKK